MGRVRSKLVKRIGKEIFEKYKDIVTDDWETNKERLKPILNTPSKKLRNQIIGYVTKLAKVEKRRGGASE